MIAGTVFYLAPEQAQGRPVDGCADLYALGVMLYEWATGGLPFTGDDALAVLTQHLYAPPVPPRVRNPSLPPALDRLIVDLLGKAPDDRPASAEVVLEILRSPSLWKPDAVGTEAPILEAIRRGRMVARETEWSQVRALWAGARTAGSRLLLVRGEAGIGKTRLLRELATLAGVSDGVVLEAWNDGRPARPFAAFRQILRRLLDERPDWIGECPATVLADLLALLPELQARHPQVEPRPSLDSAADQHHLFESVAVCLTLVSRAAPVLIVIEDAQWADSGTLLLLRYLVQQTRARPVLFVLTCRTAEGAESPELDAALEAFRREGVGTTLTLERLDASGTIAMLQALLGEAVPPELVERIQQATEGNPLYVEEVCKGLVESGRLVRRDGDWCLVDRRAVPVPASLRVAVEDRLRRLPEEARQTLEVAAVWGPVFEPAAIAELIGRDRGAAGDALAATERAEMIRPLPDGGTPRCAFTHALIAAAVVEGMAPQRRRTLHAGVAAALEAAHPDDHEALALHFREAGDTDRAVEHLLRAGDRAKALHACREAIECYQAAIDLQGEAGSRREQARTLLKLGLACSADFQFDGARQAYERAFDLWEAALEAEPPVLPTGLPVTLRYAMCEPVSLDPGRAGDDLSAFVVGQLMEGLVDLDEAWGSVPSLAARWTVTSDGRGYTFHLRPGWRWSDGRALTAHDFEYAWKRNLALAADSPAALLLYVLRGAQAYAEGRGPAEAVGVRALDDRTLEARLDHPAGYFPQLLTHPVTFPLPRWVVEGERQPWTAPEIFVCNGAWLLEAWDPGKHMAFARNPGYRGLSRGNAVRIEAPVVEDHQALLPAFEAGETGRHEPDQGAPDARGSASSALPPSADHDALSVDVLSELQLRSPSVRQARRSPGLRAGHRPCGAAGARGHSTTCAGGIPPARNARSQPGAGADLRPRPLPPLAERSRPSRRRRLPRGRDRLHRRAGGGSRHLAPGARLVGGARRPSDARGKSSCGGVTAIRRRCRSAAGRPTTRIRTTCCACSSTAGKD